MTAPWTAADLSAELHRLSNLIDSGIAALREQSERLAETEMTYRKAKAEAWVLCPTDTDAKSREWTAGRREAWVDAETADLRYRRDLAEGMRQAALEAVRARRAQLSAAMTLVAAHRSEADLARVDAR